MNWDAIGAVGEVVGAVGVILTLGYLAVQIRQNTAMMTAQTVQAHRRYSTGSAVSRRAC